jgi:hypothetical protein
MMQPRSHDLAIAFPQGALINTSSEMVQRSSIVALLYLLDVCAWIIMLGGVAAWQYQCNKGVGETTSIWTACMTAQVQLNW